MQKTSVFLTETFMDEDFLLENEMAKVLYHDYASKQAIIDYHCHLSPKEIVENRQFHNISQAWLAGDHYKWRAMRTCGVNEKFITGKANDKEKFLKWAATVPKTARNPLYHWTHLELKRYFDVNDLLNPDTAKVIYDETNQLLGQESYRVQGLLKSQNVQVVCSTDDPTDSLEYHKSALNSNNFTRLFPAFRPDKVYQFQDPKAHQTYLKELERTSNISIESFDDLLEALKKRVEYFHLMGCRLSDHGLESIPRIQGLDLDNELILSKIRKGQRLYGSEMNFFTYQCLKELCKMYHSKGWVQQFHLGALRNTNRRMLSTLGPDTGFDSIGDFPQATALAAFLDDLDSTDQLGKTILYNLNPADNEVFATMVGNFNDGSVKGKIQWGSAWWFLDQKDGMEKQLNTLSNLGMLSTFVGMLTDSRSFLSFPRHEYFRRILCNLIGKDVAHGELPWDEKWLGQLVIDICYQNAKDYFPFKYQV